MKEGRAELEHALEVLEQLEPYSLMYWEDDYCEDFYRMTFMGDLEVSIYVSEKPTAFPRLKFLKAPATRLTEAEFFEKLRMVRGEKNNTHTLQQQQHVDAKQQVFHFIEELNERHSHQPMARDLLMQCRRYDAGLLDDYALLQLLERARMFYLESLENAH